MKHILILGLFANLMACGSKKEESVEEQQGRGSGNQNAVVTVTPTPCFTEVQLTCIVRGDDQKCLVYDTKEITRCEEGKSNDK